MANLEIEGRILRKLAVQSGTSARGQWSKQEFIVEYQDGNFPSNICFNVWGEDKVRDLERYQVGDVVKVSFSPSSREFNGRWYTDLRAWRISAAGGEDARPSGFAQDHAASGPAYADVPAGFAPRQTAPQQAPAPTIDDFSEHQVEDDLPF